jgi:hypothetical protein
MQYKVDFDTFESTVCKLNSICSEYNINNHLYIQQEPELITNNCFFLVLFSVRPELLFLSKGIFNWHSEQKLNIFDTAFYQHLLSINSIYRAHLNAPAALNTFCRINNCFSINNTDSIDLAYTDTYCACFTFVTFNR